MLLNNHRDQVKDPRESPQLVPKLADFSHCKTFRHFQIDVHTTNHLLQAYLRSEASSDPQYRVPEVHFGMPWAYSTRTKVCARSTRDATKRVAIVKLIIFTPPSWHYNALL